jgi:Septum formation
MSTTSPTDPWRLLRPTRTGLLALLIALAACQSASPTPSADNASTSPIGSVAAGTASASPSASASGSGDPQGVETSIFDLRPGDCFSSGETAIVSVFVVDCSEQHVYEAFAVFDHDAGPDDEYPGDQAIGEYANSACQPPFEEYVGIAYEDSIWYITSIPPSEETWAEGDREIVCTLTNEQETEVTGSAEGSGE